MFLNVILLLGAAELEKWHSPLVIHSAEFASIISFLSLGWILFLFVLKKKDRSKKMCSLSCSILVAKALDPQLKKSLLYEMII